MIDTAAPEDPQPGGCSTDAEMPEPETKSEPDAHTNDFCIELPEETLTDAARANLDRIIESKGKLRLEVKRLRINRSNIRLVLVRLR